ncbi:DBH-like monooxygenase protein 1 [Oscarella lobularis]|uniref:DBH-like monooxygenase protein 1 n=1 Tax=Oscarella lobularis TaxID=121494 RepID=UPI0033139EBE
MRIVFLLFTCIALASTSASLSQKYDFSVNLDGDNTFWLHWTIDHALGTIDVGIEAKTTGWVGFGLSPNGQMPDSDIVTGWVKDGKATLQDRHSLGRFLPPLDPKQNVELLAASEDDTTTVIEFRRKIRACEPNDTDISPGTSNVIWAYHPKDPDTINGLMQHQKMGSKSVNLLNGLIVKPFPSGTPTFDVITDNIKVPSADTTYWCKTMKLPVVPEGGYLIGFGPVIDNKEIVHHMDVYRCDSAANYLHEDGPCNELNDKVMPCWGFSVIGGWAVGGEEVRFPDDVGIPFSGKDGVQYVMIGLHYNNEKMRSDYVDSSGMKFYYTTKKPQNLGSILEVGHIVPGDTLFIPPGLPKATVKPYCSSQCTKAGIPSGGVTVFSVFLHSHTAGAAIRLRQFRNGRDLGYIVQNNQYDFNYQNYILPLKNVTILPGDSLQTECDYDTSKRTTTTVGGFSTTQEMCLAFMIVYPAISLQYCLSEILPDSLAALTEKAEGQGWGSYYGNDEYALQEAVAALNFSKPGADAAYFDYLRSKKQTVRCRGVESYKIIPDQIVTVPTVPAEPTPTPVRPQCTTNTIAPTSAAGRVEYAFLLLLLLATVIKRLC